MQYHTKYCMVSVAAMKIFENFEGLGRRDRFLQADIIEGFGLLFDIGIYSYEQGEFLATLMRGRLNGHRSSSR